MKIALISDTHGIVREDWLDYIRGCDCMIHTGDFDNERCYERFLNLGVPAYMVRGNCDTGEWASYLPEFMPAPFCGKMFYLVHNRAYLPADLTDADFVIFGHTHVFTHEELHGKVFINPGSTTVERGSGRTMAILTLDRDSYDLQRIVL